MEFKERRGIYLQIADQMADRIVAGEWSNEERLPSIREIAADLGVNPNTVMRSYSFLQDREIITNRRGIGFYIAPDGREKILDWKRSEFISRELPPVFKTMEQLGLSVEDLSAYYRKYKEKSNNETE